jgi:hypothetical protein
MKKIEIKLNKINEKWKIKIFWFILKNNFKNSLKQIIFKYEYISF